MDTSRHENRTVVVTGGSSGIGRRICTRFAREGAHIVVADVQREPRTGRRIDTDLSIPTDEVVTDEIGGTATYVEADVTEPDEVNQLIERTVNEHDRLDVLVNNAGIYVPGGLDDVDIETWHRVLDTDLSSAFYCVKAAASALKATGGSVVNVSSHEAMYGGTGPPYTSAKAGLNNLTRDLALELGPDGVNVNAVCPGAIRTPMTDYTDEQLARRRRTTPVGRVGEPEDVAAVTVFRASDEAAFVQDECVVDGGEVARFRSPPA